MPHGGIVILLCEKMHRISFIDCESGTDLIVAFAVADQDSPSQVQSLIAMRTPKFERFLDEWERGATVSFDLDPVDDGRSLLRKVSFDEAAETIELQCDKQTYELSIRQIDKAEIKNMRKIFRKMNFDSSIEMIGI